MERRWCWRCGADRGYLDDREADAIDALVEQAWSDDGRRPQLTMPERARQNLAPAVDRYVAITGEVVGDNINFWWHVVLKHRLSAIGSGGASSTARPTRRFRTVRFPS